jgi:hypothetical protein
MNGKTIQNIARNNNFPNKLITSLKLQIQRNINPPKTRQEGKHKQHEMGHIYILQPQSEENNQPLQTNGNQDSI